MRAREQGNKHRGPPLRLSSGRFLLPACSPTHQEERVLRLWLGNLAPGLAEAAAGGLFAPAFATGYPVLLVSLIGLLC